MAENKLQFDHKSIAAVSSENDAGVSALIRLVGERVKQVRKTCHLSRRELSERSGVSPRYLAQLESGEGNISIGLLQKVAVALDQPIEAFLRQAASRSVEADYVASFYRRADAVTRTRVMEILDPDRMREQKAERICLVGLRGAGKSTLGALVGEKLGLPFIELNSAIEERVGIAIGEIIALYGQEGFRQMEADTLDDIIANHKRAIVAVAGGIVSEDSTFQQVLARFHTIWVRTTPSEHMDRVKAQGDTRPMAGNPQAMIQLREILKAREVLYEQADYELDTNGKSVVDSKTELLHLLSYNEVIAL